MIPLPSPPPPPLLSALLKPLPMLPPLPLALALPLVLPLPMLSGETAEKAVSDALSMSN